VKPRWYLERLHAMSVAEVAHRLRGVLPKRAPSRSRAAYAVLTPTFRPALVVDEALADAIVDGDRDRAQDFDDPRLEYELHRGHDWVVVAPIAKHRDWLARTLAEWRAAHPLGSHVWSSAMEAAIRIHSLLAVAAHADMPICAPMVFEHVRWLEPRLSAHSSANNHLVVELSALVAAARALGELPQLAAFEAAVATQVFADGVHAEMATHYHAFVLEALVLAAASERAFGFSHGWLDRTIVAMVDYLAALRCGDGSLLQQGDDDGGRIVPSTPLPLAPTPTSSRAFRDSGQVILRSPRLHVAFDAGPFGFGTLAAHAHCDALAIYVACDGLPFLVDRGTYKYAGDDGLRDQLRSTAAHNTLQIAALEQARVAGPFLWTHQPRVSLERCELGSDDLVIASHDGFAPFTHRRTLERRGDILRVTDRCDTALPLTVRFHFPPGLDVTLEANVARSARGSIAFAGLGSLISMPHSSAYASLTTALTLEIRGNTEISCEISPT
jgi:uncharacterized heparinase superfamily protein